MNNDFIVVYENVASPDFCKKMIAYFEDMQQSGHAISRQQHQPQITKLQKNDDAVFLTGEYEISFNSSKDLAKELNHILWDKCYADYAERYPALKEAAPHGSFCIKLQKTEIGAGYHMWHFEQDSRYHSPRLMAWTLYLNDVEEGGETEFLYQHTRIKAKQGSVCLFPAAYTHVHRGNPPISNTKYIATGWIEY